jgi:hypothetical protein
MFDIQKICSGISSDRRSFVSYTVERRGYADCLILSADADGTGMFVLTLEWSTTEGGKYRQQAAHVMTTEQPHDYDDLDFWGSDIERLEEAWDALAGLGVVA